MVVGECGDVLVCVVLMNRYVLGVYTFVSNTHIQIGCVMFVSREYVSYAGSRPLVTSWWVVNYEGSNGICVSIVCCLIGYMLYLYNIDCTWLLNSCMLCVQF